MIKINLLGDDTVIDTSGTWLVIGYALSLVGVLLIVGILYVSVSSSIDTLTTESESLDKRLKALQETTKEVRDLEKKKNELASKTSIIAILKKSKLGPVRILDDLNTAIPEKAWVTEVRESGGILRVSGLALDNQTIAAFMKSMETSDYFDTIDLGESRQVEKNGVKLKEFTIQAKVSYSGFGKVTTIVPPEVLIAGGSPTPSSTAETKTSPE